MTETSFAGSGSVPRLTCDLLPAPFSGCNEDKMVSLKKKNSHLLFKAFDIWQIWYSPVQVGVHIVIAMIFGQVNQHSRGTAAVSGPTEAAVTDASARRALPLLTENTHLSDVTNAHTQNRRQRPLSYSPDSAERLGPPLRSGSGDRGRRTGPSLPRTPGCGSWF